MLKDCQCRHHTKRSVELVKGLETSDVTFSLDLPTSACYKYALDMSNFKKYFPPAGLDDSYSTRGKWSTQNVLPSQLWFCNCRKFVL